MLFGVRGIINYWEGHYSKYIILGNALFFVKEGGCFILWFLFIHLLLYLFLIIKKTALSVTLRVFFN